MSTVLHACQLRINISCMQAYVSAQYLMHAGLSAQYLMHAGLSAQYLMHAGLSAQYLMHAGLSAQYLMHAGQCDNGDIRITRGNETEYLEMCNDTVWLAMCGTVDGWSPDTAAVACRQLGYSAMGEYTNVDVPVVCIMLHMFSCIHT